VRDGFLSIAAAQPDRYLVLDASQTVGNLADQIAQRVLALLDAR
jgi:thymidylate kinase